jgi:outer membrane protein OmpA-like peptidoglycan-associated protein
MKLVARTLTAQRVRAIGLALPVLTALAACGPGTGGDWNREAGAQIRDAGFGSPTTNNALYHSGQLHYAQVLSQRFAQEVPTTVTFAFNSARLDAEAEAVLRHQAAFMRQFPEVRFSVYGHTDLVGSAGYNQRLGQRRARAVVHHLVALGVERSRLDALVSLGETQPIVATQTEERRNRRTVTEVTGFVERHPEVLDGRYAQIAYRGYVGGSAAQ